MEDLNDLKRKALADLKAISDTEAAETWRIAYLGRQGLLTGILRGVSELPPDQRPAAGKRANEIKTELTEALAEKTAELNAAALRAAESEHLDVTRPGRVPSLGRLHLTTQTLREIYQIFARMGFQIFESPEVETDEYNFQLLNIPRGHPSRDMWSSFYIEGTDGQVLLRSHTSPGQIHAMRLYAPEPIRVILPGKCYRYEQISPRYDIQFFQVEGLAVGEAITMADLKGTLIEFARQLFGQEVEARFRCSHFPFTEPSAEMDIECIICGGAGCRVCKHTGWLEILGAGMVHPAVLENGGYDPARFSGFAFGMGVERPAMLKYGIEDIRHFLANDLRFLEQFG
ncbi:MAG: phenylalanine--tRNA ligase subunit alpha [Acidobacteriota bacterium]